MRWTKTQEDRGQPWMKNKYEIRGDVTVIFIFGRGRLHECLIDTTDLERIATSVSPNHSWYLLSSDGTDYAYTRRSRNGESIPMHRIVLGAGANDIIDHVHHNGLDNRKNELKVKSHADNVFNRRGARKGCSSGARCVFRVGDRWGVRVRHVQIGRFASKQEAERAANKVIRTADLTPFPSDLGVYVRVAKTLEVSVSRVNRARAKSDAVVLAAINREIEATLRAQAEWFGEF